ncbi:hypothetical protein KSS87_017863 [Heliosperma pusillum]|nr:hypothetical protein KSS87_017863 [Heliosperma pusillum]
MRAKQEALNLIVGDYKAQFQKLRDYAFELLRTNKGSTVKIETEKATPEGPSIFNGIYVCLDSLKKGMLESCRKVICVDGCFLKGPWNGQILVAVGRDANNQVYPFAWANVPRENYDRWNWFLKLLIDDLNLCDGKGWTIISDQQKGLVECVKGLLKEAEHRLCARHVYANLRKRWKGNLYKKIFWAIAKSSTKNQFDNNMKEMRELSIDAHQFLLDKNPTKWCRFFFKRDAQCDSVDNNMAEVFNGALFEARYKPIITMLEDIRETIMVRIKIRRALGEKMQGKVCPRIQSKIQSLKETNGGWKAISNGVGRYSVKLGSDGYVVNVLQKHCECNGWNLTGISCIHAVIALKEARVNPEDYVSDCYSVASYIKAYSYPIEPLNGMNMWLPSEGDVISPPEFKKKKRGKQQHKRRRKEGETSSKYGSVTKFGRKVRCSKCGDYGHNKQTCKK